MPAADWSRSNGCGAARPCKYLMSKRPSRKTVALEMAIAIATAGGGAGESRTQEARANAGRIMYIECKAGCLTGEARIGRVTFSKTGCTIYYRGQALRSLKGAGFKSNYYAVGTGEDYWISGPKRRGGDGMYGSVGAAAIDDDVRVEYWRDIRGQPGRVNEKFA